MQSDAVDERNSSSAIQGPFLTEDAPNVYASKISLTMKPFLDSLRLFEWKNPASDPQQQFLDIGCGTGDVTREHILPRCSPCRRLLAVDYSAKMVEYAREHFAHPKIEYRQMDIGLDVTDFLAEHGAFQRVYSLRTLHWLKDQALAFANISRLMAPGGECLLTFLGRCDIFEFFRRIAKLAPWTKYSDVLEGAVPKTHDIVDAAEMKSYMENLFRSTGLVIITLDIQHRETSFLNTENAAEMFLMANPVLPILPEDEKAAFIADARKHVPDWRSAYYEKSALPFAYYSVHAYKP
ncbi:juvenile hormone acid O-methyltransferase-like [Amblyomma americanum]